MRKAMLGLGVVAVAVCVLAVGSASAAVGVEKVDRRGGAPGDEVTLTLGCGFCFPPCEGPKGERHPRGFDHGPCMLDTKKDPPRLVRHLGRSALERAGASQMRAARRSARRLTAAPPRRAPYTFLGLAVPPPGGNNPEHGDPPRYLLHFTIPRLPAGAYAYVIWCDACAGGGRGSLIASPGTPLWRLAVRHP